MKIADRTPYRQENGQIDIAGRIQGMLKFGMAWYDLIRTQDDVTAILEKVLDQKYILLRNITLPDTEIDLPMVLIGPPGIFLINVINDRGVYRARDDEWGMISGEKFVPAKINQVQRTSKLGRVLQIYIERAGYKNQVPVEPILLSANPGMHIESVRPVVRVVMSDALERFAMSINQAKIVLSGSAVIQLAKIMINGPEMHPEPVEAPAPGAPLHLPMDVTIMQGNPASEPAGEETLSFTFEEETNADATLPSAGPAQEMNTLPGGVATTADAGASAKTPTVNAPTKRIAGFTRAQLAFLGGMVLIWLCIMAGFAIYIYLNLR